MTIEPSRKWPLVGERLRQAALDMDNYDQTIRQLEDEIARLRAELDAAKERNDLRRAAELTYGAIPSLQHRLRRWRALH
jgi:uncharacterized small protein (DUF1192 family)